MVLAHVFQYVLLLIFSGESHLVGRQQMQDKSIIRLVADAEHLVATAG